MYKRFLAHAMERIIDRSETSYSRRDETTTFISKGNEAVHSANALAHVALFETGHLSPGEIGTFEKMHGFHPSSRYMVMVKPLVDIYSMTGTMTNFSPENKLEKLRNCYDDFASSAQVAAEIWTKLRTAEISLQATHMLNCD
jgi:hypothetical protein